MKNSDGAAPRYAGELNIYNGHKRGLKAPQKLLERARIWPFAIGIVLVLLAIAFEHLHLLHTPAAAEHEAAPPATMVSAIFNAKTLILWTAEVGYAFIIGGVISAFMEFNARRELNDEIREAQEQISRDLIQHVYGIKHTADYVRAVVGTCFESPIVREGYDVTYDLKPFDPDEATRAGIDAGRFALVEVTIRYTARNVGGEAGTFKTGYGIPLRKSGKLRNLSRITKLAIGDQVHEGSALSAFEADHAHGDVDERMYQFDIELEPNASAAVAIEATLVKELSDNDAFGFRRPTLGAEIKINDRIGGLHYGLTPRTSALLEKRKEARPGGSGEWELRGPILPYDSVVIWWRTPEDDGEPQPEAPQTPTTRPGLEMPPSTPR